MSIDGEGMLPPEANEMEEDRRNGYAYSRFLPTPAASLDESMPELAAFGDFTEFPEIIEELHKSGALLVNGAPGSGKSHLVRDALTGSVLYHLPIFTLTMHINAGKAGGLDNIREPLEDFREKAGDTGGGLIILDNLDIIAYRGKSRPRERTRRYAEAALPLVAELVEDRDIAVLATAHDDAWREGRWTWDDDGINEAAQAVLDLFPASFEFEGKMALEGLAHILWSRMPTGKVPEEGRREGDTVDRPMSIGQAAQVMEMLAGHGRADFFHARHLNIPLFLEDPEAAIAEIDHERDIRRGKA